MTALEMACWGAYSEGLTEAAGTNPESVKPDREECIRGYFDGSDDNSYVWSAPLTDAERWSIADAFASGWAFGSRDWPEVGDTCTCGDCRSTMTALETACWEAYAAGLTAGYEGDDATDPYADPTLASAYNEGLSEGHAIRRNSP